MTLASHEVGDCPQATSALNEGPRRPRPFLFFFSRNRSTNFNARCGGYDTISLIAAQLINCVSLCFLEEGEKEGIWERNVRGTMQQEVAG